MKENQGELNNNNFYKIMFGKEGTGPREDMLETTNSNDLTEVSGLEDENTVKVEQNESIESRRKFDLKTVFKGATDFAKSLVESKKEKPENS